MISNNKNLFEYYKKGILSFFMFLIFLWSLSFVNWGEELFHTGGKSTIKEIIRALFHPDLSIEILNLALIASLRTLAYAIAAMSLAIVLAFVFGILGSGILVESRKQKNIFRYIFRAILGFMRGIHELVWAWLFVASIGLSPFAAIFAIAIPYGGSLGRIFADILEDVKHEPINGLKSCGASNLQVLIYGYLPMSISNMISYTMYRLECAIRSSTIMSFVGLGGLGYQINLSLADLKFDQVWTFLFFLIALVILVDLWSNKIRDRLTLFKYNDSNNKFNFLKISIIMAIILIVFSWIFVFKVDNAEFFSLFTSKNLNHTKKFLFGMAGIGELKPAFLDIDSIKNIIKLSFETFQMSILSIGFASVAMILSVIWGSKNIANGSLGISRKIYDWPIFYIVRLVYVFSRAIPELVWAMIIIFIFKPGILPGAIALSIHNFGILGKLCAEVIEDLDTRPISNLVSCGASRAQILLYGIIPSVMPKFLTFILYRWEVIVRTTIVVGFVGAGGLGQEFKLSMSWFHYSNVTLVLIAYLILVFISDSLCEFFRKVIED